MHYTYQLFKKLDFYLKNVWDVFKFKFIFLFFSIITLFLKMITCPEANFMLAFYISSYKLGTRYYKILILQITDKNVHKISAKWKT